MSSPSHRRARVCQLAWKTSKETLDELFTAYGAVYANIKTDNSGRSKGYGIVRCADAAQATQAISTSPAQGGARGAGPGGVSAEHFLHVYVHAGLTGVRSTWCPRAQPT